VKRENTTDLPPCRIFDQRPAELKYDKGVPFVGFREAEIQHDTLDKATTQTSLFQIL
jgi:hypothetical protein